MTRWLIRTEDKKCAWSVDTWERNGVEISLTTLYRWGSVIVEQDSVLKWEFADSRPSDVELLSRLGGGSATTGGAADPKAISFVGHQMQLQDFVEAIAEGRAPRVDGREGRRSVEVILALYQAAKTGASVRLTSAVKGS